MPLQEVPGVSRGPAAPATPAGERSPERFQIDPLARYRHMIVNYNVNEVQGGLVVSSGHNQHHGFRLRQSDRFLFLQNGYIWRTFHEKTVYSTPP